MKKSLFVVALAFVAIIGSSGSAYAAGPTKHVVVAGSGGLDVAAKECAPHLGQPSWQACVAHHDGLYTPNADGSISRNYIRVDDAPAPNADGPITCEAKFVAMQNGDIGWEFPTNPKCKGVARK
ncbi:hypothetical protein EPN27_00680 [Patescibacteria group bacterium]|nr:MAG: hypothetical protein EPN27_00680 [Patescibacteria group bacterium]